MKTHRFLHRYPPKHSRTRAFRLFWFVPIRTRQLSRLVRRRRFFPPRFSCGTLMILTRELHVAPGLDGGMIVFASSAITTVREDTVAKPIFWRRGANVLEYLASNNSVVKEARNLWSPQQKASAVRDCCYVSRC